MGIWNQTFLLDTTVSSIHVKANFEKNACFKSIGYKEVDIYQGSVADKAELAKNVLYSNYARVESGLKDDKKVETMKHIVPFALDSRGGIGMDALDFIRIVYGKQVPGGPVREWKSDKMRTNWRNQFMDKLSCLMARHRVLDYTYMGIPGYLVLVERMVLNQHLLLTKCIIERRRNRQKVKQKIKQIKTVPVYIDIEIEIA